MGEYALENIRSWVCAFGMVSEAKMFFVSSRLWCLPNIGTLFACDGSSQQRSDIVLRLHAFENNLSSRAFLDFLWFREFEPRQEQFLIFIFFAEDAHITISGIQTFQGDTRERTSVRKPMWSEIFDEFSSLMVQTTKFSFLTPEVLVVQSWRRFTSECNRRKSLVRRAFSNFLSLQYFAQIGAFWRQ